MSTEFHERVRFIVEAATGLPVAERAAFVVEATGDDARLRAEVDAMLPYFESAGEFVPTRPLGSQWRLPGTTTFTRTADACTEDMDWTPPFCIAPYTVVSVVGRGGMGVVYRAIHPTRGCYFAIKVLRRRLISREDRRRFMFEEEVLRQLQHPGIARLQHGGIARIMHPDALRGPPDRRPYFVMEYIDGAPLTRYAEEQALDARERIALLAKTCEAVDYAHQRGVIHRDLKPDNILVNAAGDPKVVDFGIAHVLAFESSVVQNEDGHFAGTLEYCSPEQKAGRVTSLTPTADVYALGLIAHELLTGELPRRVGAAVRPDLRTVHLCGHARKRDEARDREFCYYLSAVIGAALRVTEGPTYQTAGELGADLGNLLAFFPARPRGSIFQRLLSHLSPAPEERSTMNRPLSAVLRKRIAMALEHRDVDTD